MKLIKVRITEYQSILDSNEFEVGDITCLVGKNEAGKTALLKALYRLNPIIEADGDFDVTNDYPRRSVTDYEDAVTRNEREPAEVVQATYKFEANDIATIEKEFGPNCLLDETPEITLSKGYTNEVLFNNLSVDKDATLMYLLNAAGFPHTVITELINTGNTEGSIEALEKADQTEELQRHKPILREIFENSIEEVIFGRIFPRIPKFLYFDEYYQLKGQDNLNSFKERAINNDLEPSDYPLMGLIELAGLNWKQIDSLGKTESLLAKLEAAENQLTEKVLKYWSQNRHLRMSFDIRQGQPEDPPGMNSGLNIWARVRDTRHMVSTALGTRSRGFVWFFSFLAWYSQQRKKDTNIILLLDEPGLSLHGKAQEDLLFYFEQELKPHNQLIYTTHSPFMVDPRCFDRARIVQDKSLEADVDNLSPEQEGTKVIKEVLDATPDSLFPLQGALGYEIYQTLFIGPNSLVVEGVSDLLYIQTISSLLIKRGKEGLSDKWIITPVGGIDKVPTFVALIGAQKRLNLAVLTDYQKKDQQLIENLYKRKLLSKKKVLTYRDFVQSDEADIEDLFNPEFYINLVNNEYGSSINLEHLTGTNSRILRRLTEYLDENPLPNKQTFNHYRPARYLSSNIDTLEKELSEEELKRFESIFQSLNKLL